MDPDTFAPQLFLPFYRQKSALYTAYLLKMLSIEKAPLLFLFESHVRLVYSTMVLAVDREGGTILLDALHPDMGNEHLVPGSTVTFFGKMKGIDTGFRARILGRGKMDEGSALRLAFPHETYYLERRNVLRVPLPPDLPKVCLRKTSGSMEYVRPVNIGGGGLRVLLPERDLRGEPDKRFDVGDLVLIERLEFNGFHLPPLSGMVVHCEHAGNESGIALQGLGIAFIDLPSDSEEALSSYVSRKDREMLRNFRPGPEK